MKRLDEYTQKELANLSDEEIQNIIDIECAFEGVRLLPPKPEEYVAKVFEPDSIVYNVGQFQFKNQEDALKVIDVLKSVTLVNTTYDYSVGYNYYYIDDKLIDAPNLETKKVFSKQTYNDMKAEMTKVNKEKDSHKDQKNLYDEIVKERKSVVDNVYETINEAVDKENEKQRIINQYNRYLVLADNNTTTAKKFLADALHISSEEVENLELS